MTDWDIDSGQPLKHDADDRLHFVPLARKLAPLVLAKGRQDCLVVGLYAPWGHGKSSLLNLLENALPGVEDGPVPIIVRFNPWLYSSTESLLYSFFGSIAEAIGASSIRDKELKAKTAKRVRDLGKVAGPLLTTAAQLPPGAGGALINTAAALLEGGESTLEKAKKDAGDALLELFRRKKPARLVVLIDDLDRAEPAEVRAMLRLVRLVADLPNTTYVLAMDNVRVGAAIADGTSGDGQAFLEKIVGVAYHLPPVPPEAIRKAVRGRLDPWLEAAGGSASALWQDGVGMVVLDQVRSFRDVARFTNAARLVLASGTDGVHLGGLLGVIALQIFHPEVYGRIRGEQHFLTSEVREMSTGESPEADEDLAGQEIASRVRRLFELVLGRTVAEGENVRLNDRAREAKRLLDELFPSVVDPWHVPPSFRRYWRRAGCIVSAHRFQRYFRIVALPGESIGRRMDTSLRDLGDAGSRRDGAAAATIWQTMVGESPDAFWAELEDRLTELDGGETVAVLQAVLLAVPATSPRRIVTLLDAEAMSRRLESTGMTEWTVLLPDLEPSRPTYFDICHTLIRDGFPDPWQAVLFVDLVQEAKQARSRLDVDEMETLRRLAVDRMSTSVLDRLPFGERPLREAVDMILALQRLGDPAVRASLTARLQEHVRKRSDGLAHVAALISFWPKAGPMPLLDRSFVPPAEFEASVEASIGIAFLKKELGRSDIPWERSDPYGLFPELRIMLDGLSRRSAPTPPPPAAAPTPPAAAPGDPGATV